MNKYLLLQVSIEKDGDVYAAVCPALTGCVSWGKTYKEAYQNIQEAIECHIEALQKLHKSKYALFPKSRYLRELEQPSVVTMVKDAS